MMDPNTGPMPVRRPRRSSLVTGISLILLLVAVGFVSRQWWWPAPKLTGPKSLGPLPNCLRFSPDRSAKYIAAAFSDGKLRVWETATREEVPVKLPSQWPLNDVVWLSDGSAALTGGFEQHVLMWNIKAVQARELPKFDAPVVSIAVHPRKPELLVSLSQGELLWLEMKTGKRETVTTGHKGTVKVVHYSPHGKTFATGGSDGQLVWHDAESRDIVKSVAAHQHELASLEFSSDSQRLVTGGWDNTAKVWPLNGAEPSSTLTHPDGVAHVAWQEQNIVTSCWDGRLRVWDASSGTALREHDCQSDTLTFAVWPGRKEVAEVDASGELTIYVP